MASSSSSSSRYYFAYGSNLHMEQMKRRCPNSRYVGRAELPDHRWQINDRGYANIVAAQGHHVQGLVYEIDAADEARLDLCEGVATSAYQKRHLPVLLHRALGPLYRRPVSWIVAKGGPDAVCRAAASVAASPPPRQLPVPDVLVYVSFHHVQDSAPRHEYVRRINLGIADARILGIDDDYIQKSIRPFIPEPPAGDGPATSVGALVFVARPSSTVKDLLVDRLGVEIVHLNAIATPCVSQPPPPPPRPQIYYGPSPPPPRRKLSRES
ncbi:hypothetical protein L249_4682 [Ophiocordyceps polyrhachis-furcata BCC 54312]|uniref:gamma-glutamylcyclotransferase n=1 Tax=Ophiocordyceps polyrhachis-furcata BCC 54312 TaxID=1330021 RepID=A0A367L2S3_9HYPO|nr:hypothetical protein L249_4682 [Ophiocordyceps polyrhachis-furcata BCC 54312]